MSTPQDHDRTHELLCAWILGETSEEEAREVQAALEASPELRAERERLEGTIGLMRDAYSGEARLSDGAMAHLLRQAGGGAAPAIRRPGPGWVHSPFLRAAAAVIAVAGGVTWIVTGGRGDRIGGIPVATAPAEGVWEEGQELNAEARRGIAPDSPADSSEELLKSGALVPDPLVADAEEPPAGRPIAALEAPEFGDRLRADGTELERDSAQQYYEELLRDPKDLPAFRAQSVAGLDEAGRKNSPEGAASESQAARLGQRAQAGGEDTFLGREEYKKDSDDKVHAKLEERGAGSVAGQTGKAVDPPARDRLKRDRLNHQLAVTPPPVAAGETVVGGGRGPGDSAPGGARARAPAGPASPGPKAHTRRKELTTPPSAGTGGVGVKGPEGEVERRPAEETGGRYYGESLDELERNDFGFFFDDDRDGVSLFGRRGGRLIRHHTEHELRELARLYSDRRFQWCRRRPQETPRDMFFRFWGDNPFEDARRDSQSTFSVDVDTASYALARRYLNEGHLPTKQQVRTEEFLNYFDADLPAPLEETFALHTELAPSLFGGRADRWMLRVGLRGREVPREERLPFALTFVVDTSGSMRENNRLELVKHSMRLLVSQLGEGDRIAIVAYSNEARLVLPMTPVEQGGVIEAAIHPLRPNGSTNAEAGLRLGYELALTALETGVHNRVVFLSDGVANVGQTDQDRINSQISRHRERGIYLNTIGVGMNNHNDVFLEQLADKGDGVCDYVDTPEAARRAIVERFTSAMIPIASDVKVQVDFDATQVARYRLLGYENRAIADKDFRNDAVDAGELGSGHQVVALYELELLANDDPAGSLATVRVRWKAPKVARQDPLEVDVTEIEHAVLRAQGVVAFGSASPGYRRSVLVAQFAEFLRRSEHARLDSFALLEEEATRLAGEIRDPDFDEFRGLVKKAFGLGLQLELLGRDQLRLTLEEYKRYLYLRAQIETIDELRQKFDNDRLQRIRDRNDELEDLIRDLIYEDLKGRNG